MPHISFYHCLDDAYRAAMTDGFTHAASLRGITVEARRPIADLLAGDDAVSFIARESILYNRESGLILGPDDAIHLYRNKAAA